MSLLTSRRDFLATLTATAIAAHLKDGGAAAAKTLRGAFMILNTPFTHDGMVDWDDLAREAGFVDRAGCQGIVWPQGSSAVATLTKAERLRGMEVIAHAVHGKQVALVLGVQGRDTAEMLEYAARAEALAPDAVIAMPPSSAASLEDYRSYFRALAGAVKRPVILQTSGGARNLVPTVDLIVDLAREFPHCGYVKEESEPVLPRMRDELRQRPPMRGVFGASFGVGWLYGMRLGLDGVITGNAMYADLMARMWDFHTRGQSEELREAYSRFLLMRNLDEQVPGTNLYVLKKRGIFKTTVTRAAAPVAGQPPKINEVTLPPDAIDEIEYRFAALQPYLVTSVGGQGA